MSQGKWQSDPMGAGCKQHTQPGRNVACVNNCGFFGSETTLHMCANCYRSYLSNSRAGAASEPTSTSPASPAPADGSPTPSTFPSSVDNAPLAAQGASSMEEEPQPHADTCPAPTAAGPREGFPRARSDAGAMARDAEQDDKLAEASLPGISDDTMPLAPTESAVEAAVEECAGVDCLVRSDACRAMDIAKAPELDDMLIAPASPAPMAAAATPAPVVKPAHKPSRCQVCRKKVGLTGFRCRCEGLFCGTHRYWDQHSCTFDYKTMERESIARANPVVIADKIVRF